SELEFLPDYTDALGGKKRTVSVATGEASYEFIKLLCYKLMSLCENLKIHVYKITNNFFGEKITVSGLLTGKDLAEQLSDKELGETLVLPANTLRSEGDLFLCGMSKEELAEKLSVEIAFSTDEGYDFVSKIFGVEPF
ncbi:MAG: DUF512 domain-containing protein, partial [Clostridia bacterium]|nr:DUF512 domain-containing protein [Clostridia bacterium]